MVSIGVRELRQHASRYLRRVQAGETIEVTDRGRRIALIVPPPPEDGGVLARLEAEGKITRAKGDLLELEPLPHREGTPLPSEVLAALREHER
jgi:prevent-host-death family protein